MERCERVREHLIELELPVDDGDRAARAEVMRRAMGNEFIESCAGSMAETQTTCILAAMSSASVAECIAARSGTATASTEARRTK